MIRSHQLGSSNHSLVRSPLKRNKDGWDRRVEDGDLKHPSDDDQKLTCTPQFWTRLLKAVDPGNDVN